MDTKSREKKITQTSIIGILVNLVLAVFKILAGFLSGSISIMLDAVNSFTDAVGSIITIIGIKLAGKHPDDKHPFGYGRIEYITAIILSLLILTAGGTSVIESVKKILEPEMPEFSAVIILIVAVSIVVKYLLGSFFKKRGKAYNSDALLATGAETSFDALVSVATLVSAAIAIFFHVSVDGILGAAIALFIVKAGIEMLLDALRDVMGNRPDAEITKAIKASVRELPGVLGAYDLVMHDYGPDKAMGSIHVEIPADMSAANIHHLTKKIQQTVMEKYHVFLTVGIYAVEAKDEKILEARAKISEIGKSFEGAINTHGIYINREEKEISFDITADFSIRDKKGFCQQVEEKVREAFPGYSVEVKLDINYSD